MAGSPRMTKNCAKDKSGFGILRYGGRGGCPWHGKMDLIVFVECWTLLFLFSLGTSEDDI